MARTCRTCRAAASCSTGRPRMAASACCCRSSRSPCSGRCSSSSSSARATTASAKATSRRCSNRSSATRCAAARSRRSRPVRRVRAAARGDGSIRGAGQMQPQHNATAKHGLATGSYQPERPDWTIDQGWANYTAEEHAVWKTLFERQRRLLPGRACDEFIRGMNELPIAPDRIPNFEELSDILMKRTGWQIVAVPGLVPDDVFFEHLANRRFPAGQFIRKPDELDYLEEPEIGRASCRERV